MQGVPVRMHGAFCFHFTAARRRSSMASVPVFCRDFWAERKKPRRGRTIWNALRYALRINSGIRFFIRDSEKPAGFSESPFHRRGRKGKRHLPQLKQKSPGGRVLSGEERTDDSLLISPYGQGSGPELQLRRSCPFQWF